MSLALSMVKRQEILSLHKQGISKRQISKTLQISRTTVHTLLSRYESEGEAGLKARYGNCGKSRRSDSDFIYRAVRCMKSWHPSWGGDKIHAELSRLRPELELPSVRTMYRWWHWNNQIKTGSNSKLPPSDSKWASELHEGWQIDAKEEIKIADKSKECWLNIKDEHSGTVVGPPVFPPQENL